MYKILIENFGRLNGIKNKYYADALGITPQYISNIFHAKLPVKKNVALGILSIAYQLPINSEAMEELLERHFTKLN